ncbi:MAG: hypothetical protein IJ880_06080 [Bacilli bacterium]|nr:hypothetical protein [Bacilli bacterium]
MKCKFCGSYNNENSLFCSRCGTKLIKNNVKNSAYSLSVVVFILFIVSILPAGYYNIMHSSLNIFKIILLGPYALLVVPCLLFVTFIIAIINIFKTVKKKTKDSLDKKLILFNCAVIIVGIFDIVMINYITK